MNRSGEQRCPCLVPDLKEKASTLSNKYDFFLKIYLLTDWLIAMLGLHFCARAFSSCGKRGPLFIAVCGPLTVAASLVAEHRLQTRRLSSCGARAQLLRGMWDPPRPGLEPVSPALAGGLSTTAPPGKPNKYDFYVDIPKTCFMNWEELGNFFWILSLLRVFFFLRAFIMIGCWILSTAFVMSIYMMVYID